VPLVIGFFHDEHGVDYAMVVNRDHAKPAEFPLTFLPHVVSVSEIIATDGAERLLDLSNQQVKLRLAAGDGKLLKLTNLFQYPEPPKPLDVIDFQFDRESDLKGWDGFNSLTGEGPQRVGDHRASGYVAALDPGGRQARQKVGAWTGRRHSAWVLTILTITDTSYDKKGVICLGRPHLS